MLRSAAIPAMARQTSRRRRSAPCLHSGLPLRQRLLDARIVFDHVHAERVERADRVEFVDERVHDDEVLVTVLRRVPQGIARTAGRHEAERLVDGYGTRVLFRHGHPNAVHAEARRFRREAVRHHAGHDVSRVAAAAVVLAEHHLDAGGTRPAVDVDEEDHADHVVGRGRVKLAVAVMVGFGDDGPCDGTTRFRIPHAGFVRFFAIGPCHGTTHPRVHSATFGHAVLAGDAGCADVRLNDLHACDVVDGGRAQVHHLALDGRNDDAFRQLPRPLVRRLFLRCGFSVL